MKNKETIYNFNIYNLLEDKTEEIFVLWVNNLEEAKRLLHTDKKYVEHITVILSLEVSNPQFPDESYVYSVKPCNNNGWLQVHELTVPTCDINASYIKKDSNVIERGVVCKEFLLSECSHYKFDNQSKPIY